MENGENGKEYVVTKIEKYNNELSWAEKAQIVASMGIGAAVMMFLCDATSRLSMSPIEIGSSLILLGSSAYAFMTGMIAKINIRNDIKELIKSQMENMTSENLTEGKTR